MDYVLFSDRVLSQVWMAKKYSISEVTLFFPELKPPDEPASEIASAFRSEVAVPKPEDKLRIQ